MVKSRVGGITGMVGCDLGLGLWGGCTELCIL
jgi:hypothetical protein